MLCRRFQNFSIKDASSDSTPTTSKDKGRAMIDFTGGRTDAEKGNDFSSSEQLKAVSELNTCCFKIFSFDFTHKIRITLKSAKRLWYNSSVLLYFYI